MLNQTSKAFDLIQYSSALPDFTFIHRNTIHFLSAKGGVAVTKAVKILALPRRGEGGSDPCQDLFGGFDIVT